MDFIPSQEPNNTTFVPRSKTAEQFALAAFVLGIASLILLNTVFLPFVLGSLSLIFASLSRDHESRMPKRSVYAVAISLFSMIFTAVLIVTMVYLIFYNEAFRNILNEAFMETYGITFENYMDMMMEIYETGTIPNNLPQEIFDDALGTNPF